MPGFAAKDKLARATCRIKTIWHLMSAPTLAYVARMVQSAQPRSEKRATFSIRKATDADAPYILECLRTAFEEYRDSYTPEAFLDTVCTTETVGRRLAEKAVFVAISDSGQIVGTVACAVASEGEGHIRGMAVRPNWQGAGVATELLSCAESELRDRKCARISLDTTQPLQRAMRFYEKNGFHRTGKVADFFGMPLFEYLKTLK